MQVAPNRDISAQNSACSTVIAAVLLTGEAYPDNGYRFIESDGGEEFVSFKELCDAIGQRAANLVDLGVRTGDKVFLYIESPREFVINFFSLMFMGAIPVNLPLKPKMAGPSFAERLLSSTSNLHASSLVVQESLKDEIKGFVDGHVENFFLIDSAIKTFSGIVAPAAAAPDETAFIQLTSGTTSAPKSIEVTHANLMANVGSIMGQQFLSMDPHTDRAISWLPMYHDMGLIGFVICPIVWGVSTVFLSTRRFMKRPTLWFDLIDKHRISTTYAPNFAFDLMLRLVGDDKAAAWDLSCLRYLGCGAEPINAELLRRFAKKFSDRSSLPANALKPAYGLAENTLAVTLTRNQEALRTKTICRSELERSGIVVDVEAGVDGVEYVSCGIPIEHHDVFIAGADGQRLGADRIGQICIQGPSVARSFCPAASRATNGDASSGHVLMTGDLGFMSAGHLYVTGRLSDIVIHNGRNINPHEIEWLIETIPGIRKGTAVAFSIQAGGQERICVAMAVSGSSDDAIVGVVKSQVLSNLSLPLFDIVVVHAQDIPKTTSGKLQRHIVKNNYLRGVYRNESIAVGL